MSSGSLITLRGPSSHVFMYIAQKEHIIAAQAPCSMPFPVLDFSKDIEARGTEAEGP